MASDFIWKGNPVLSTATKYNVLDKDGLESLKASEPERFQYRPEGGAYLNLKGVPLLSLPEIDEKKIAELCRIVRGLVFAAVDSAKSGHPGGSSSKTEQLITLLTSGVLGFDALDPKHTGRDRVVWSAGHCSPLFHALISLVYEALRNKGVKLAPEVAEKRSSRSRSPHSAPTTAPADTWNRTTRWPTLPRVLPATAFPPGWASRSCIAPAGSPPRPS